MRAKDYLKQYNEIFPHEDAKPIEVVETPVGNEEKEVVESPVKVEENEVVENGNNGNDNGLD